MMTEPKKVYGNPHLSHVAVEPPSPFAPWSQRLVKRKYAVDAWLSGSGTTADIEEFTLSFPDAWLRTWRTVDAWSFVRVVLPFFDVAERESWGKSRDKGLLWLDPSVVIGDSGRWKPSDRSEQERVETLESRKAGGTVP